MLNNRNQRGTHGGGKKKRRELKSPREDSKRLIDFQEKVCLNTLSRDVKTGKEMVKKQQGKITGPRCAGLRYERKKELDLKLFPAPCNGAVRREEKCSARNAFQTA